MKDGFYSAYTAEEMLNFTHYTDLHYVVGIVLNGKIIKPLKCKSCGEYLYIDDYTGYGQCSHCGDMFRVYYSNKLNARNDWSCYNGSEDKQD